MTPIECAIEDMTGSAKNYANDLAAMTDEQILGAAGGCARKPVDFTYEVALINKRVAARLKGQEPPTMPHTESWIEAPAELHSKAAISEYMATACEELISAAKSLEDGNKLVGPPGKEQPAYSMVNFCSMHTMYHTAQLNFIQSLNGDMAVHWS